MPITIDTEAIYSPEEAADLLSYDPKSLAMFRSQGGGPAFSKRGKRIYYLGRDLKEWLLGGRVHNTSEVPAVPIVSNRVFQKHVCAVLAAKVADHDISDEELSHLCSVPLKQVEEILAGHHDDKCAAEKLEPLRSALVA